MSTTIEITATHATFGAGKFDTDNRYLRKVVTGQVTALLRGPTLAFNSNASLLAWRFESGSYVVRSVGYFGSTTLAPPANVANTTTKIAL